MQNLWKLIKRLRLKNWLLFQQIFSHVRNSKLLYREEAYIQTLLVNVKCMLYLLYTLYILHTHIYAKFPVTAYIKSFKAFCCDKFDLLKIDLYASVCSIVQKCFYLLEWVLMKCWGEKGALEQRSKYLESGTSLDIF